jgi:phospholipid transport system substrate-binding protein
MIRVLTLLLLSAAAFSNGAVALAAEADEPSQIIQNAASEMLKELDAHRADYRKDPGKVSALVDRVLLPHFDSQYAAQQVLAKYWRTASPEQRDRFIKAFYQSLLRNYGAALLEFTADRMTILPFAGDLASGRAVIRTQVKRDNGTQVPVNYSVHKTDKGWMAYDVSIEGISYIKSYRTDFGAEIDQKGLDEVIDRLEKQQCCKSAMK